MRAVLAATAVLLVIGCDRAHPSLESSVPTVARISVTRASSSTPATPRSPVRCTTDPTYPGLWNLSEASAAVEFEPRPGERTLIAFADSGNHGEAMLWPIAPPGPLRSIKLELDKAASDDIEGAAWTGGHLYTLTSSGAVRRYTPAATGDLVRDRTAYAIGPAAYLCDSLYNGNCGKNFEGLCLRSSTKKARCAGYAASKADGTLLCVVFRGDALALDTSVPPMKLAVRPDALSDCAFGSAGGPAEEVLIVATNVYGGSVTYVVDESTAAMSALDIPGLLNNEAVAIDRDGALYEFMDANTSVSQSFRTTCTGWTGPHVP